ncbi:MAG: 16S rRNA (cytosine(967)-C(5))-methyltransferase RsmB [Desulfobacterales bacterium]|nr:16S rRNA (cytosine(967)-C(5))-methyltransferase RsmB [Desulfobacterales bacterium]
MRNKTPRAICLDLLNRMEEADRHPDDLLTDSFKRYRHLTPLDRSFLTELTYGTLRWRGKLDWIIRHFSNVPFEKIETSILHTLRIGLYQILFMSRTPISAAVNESVELAKKFRSQGGASFVNAILRSFIRQKEEMVYPALGDDPALHIAVIQSHPLWLVQRWVDEMGVQGTLKVCVDNNQIAPLTLRANTLKISRDRLIEALKEKGLEPFPTTYSKEGIELKNPPPVSELPSLKEGLYVIQDEASQLVSAILDPKPGEKILDTCAAPGSKTTHMAQRMGNEGEIFALDLTTDKLRLIEEACLRLNVKNVKVMKGDARRLLPTPGDQKFDRILADVPCSGFGTVRRNPDLKWRKSEEDVRRLSAVQASILSNLSGYLREEGVLVYSTCTIFHEENEDVIERFLSEHSAFEPDRIDKVLPENCHSLITQGCFKTFPQGEGMDGFFAVRLMKKSR